MSQIELLPFQTKASDQIAERFHRLNADEMRPLVHRNWAVPYYQALSSLTGSGKTPILADAVTQLRAHLTTEPMILWISKGKAVVDQTYANFSAGGKYSHLIEGFLVTYLSELKADSVRDPNVPLMILTTVGSFNQKGKEEGTLKVHKSSEDAFGGPLWPFLTERPIIGSSDRRPLVIVYDEGHNLTDQQTDILLELEPDAILVASATMRTPGKLGRVIQRLKEYGWSNEDLVTEIGSKKVVLAGLVKRQVVLGGYATLLESALDDMLSMMDVVGEKAIEHATGFTPKAIYVCRTNISQDDGSRDSPSRPFVERKAPPILIWRHLVEQKNIDPADIAVYCDLKFERKTNPPPEGFVHFSGGEEDFATFQAGNYHHIIFNQSLQEGWDDPECCFAYIDKSMGSPVQVEQVIGRVLRQPGARHYPDADLNTANFYIRIDDKQVFPAILELVRKKLGSEYPQVSLDSFTDHRERQRMRQEPETAMSIPEIHINSEEALNSSPSGDLVGPFVDVLEQVIDYRNDETNTFGKGEKMRAVQVIGEGGIPDVSVVETKHSNRVMARWIVRRGVQSLYPEVVKLIDWSAPKFDAKVEITSPAAATLRDAAEKLVRTYLQFSELSFEEGNLYTVGPILVNPNKLEKFKNALHEGYSDLKPLELQFARAIDETGLKWLRNPSNGGFSIPLLATGDTRNFFPDFLVWKGGVIYALDPKGDHLIANDAGRKLLNIRDEKGRQKVVVRLFTAGKWDDPKTKRSEDGFTVWSMAQSGQPRPKHCASIPKAIEAALKV